MELAGHAKEVAEELAKLDSEAKIAVIEAALGDHSVCRKMLAATGRLPEALQPAIDTQPVWTPPTPPPLTAVKQPLIDTVKIRTAKASERFVLFDDYVKFQDGTRKTAADTNMHQAGSLGYPREYDFRWIELHFEDYDPGEARRALEAMEFTFYFGCNTPWVRLSGSAWSPLLPRDVDRPVAKLLAEQIASKGPVPWDRIEAVLHEFGGAFLKTLEEAGHFWPHYWQPIVRLGSKPRRISSTESFRAEVSFPGGLSLDRGLSIKAAMQDTLYTQL